MCQRCHYPQDASMTVELQSDGRTRVELSFPHSELLGNRRGRGTRLRTWWVFNADGTPINQNFDDKFLPLAVQIGEMITPMIEVLRDEALELYRARHHCCPHCCGCCH